MKKLLIMLGAAILAVALLVSVVSFLFSGSSYDEVEAIHELVYSPDEKQLFVIYDGELAGSPIECDSYRLQGYSEDFTVCFFLTTSGEGDEEETKYYVANEDEITALPESDLEYGLLSADGKQLVAAERKENDDGETTRSYYFYDIASGEKTEFKHSGDEIDGAEFSKSFESVLYTALSTEGEGEETEIKTTLYLYNDGESVKLASDMYPVAVSDDAKYIYAYTAETSEEEDDEGSYFDSYYGSSTTYTLYSLTKDGEKTKIAEKFDRYSVTFNSDLSQLLFIADDNAYFCENGEEKVKVASNATSIFPIAPRAAVGIDDFIGTPVRVYTGDSRNVYRIEDDEPEKLISDVDSATLTSDGETIYFLKNESLRSIDVDDPSGEETIIKDDVRSIYVSKDGKDVYILDKEDTLYYVNGIEDKEKIADDVDDITMTGDAVILYTDEDDTLYYTEGGSKGEKIADDVCYFSSTIGTVIYFADKSSSTGYASAYISGNGKKFENLASGKEFRIPGSEYNY